MHNLYKNSAPSSKQPANLNASVNKKALTNREIEIANLIKKGVTPVNISQQLFLSLPTVYKHIANIHQKLDVSNRQELLLKLINFE